MALRYVCFRRFKRHIYCKKVFLNARLLHNRMITCRYGFDTQQSQRSEMQDTIYHSSNFNVNNKQYCLFGVFDGHGQDLCAKFLANNIEPYLSKNLQKYDVTDAFKTTMNEMDMDFNNSNAAYKYINIGSTACIALIDKSIDNPIIHVSNVGDSRCVLVDNICNNFNVTSLTIDHHPKVNQYEKERLLQVNHKKITEDSILHDEYFGLSLAMSRCIGNEHLKIKNKNIYICEPDITTYKINNYNQYLLLYSDGFTFKKNDIENIFDLVHKNKYDLTNDDLNILSYRLTSYVVNGTIHDGFDEKIGQYYMELKHYLDDEIDIEKFDDIFKYFCNDKQSTEKNMKTIGRLIKMCVFNFDDERRFKIMEESLFPYELEEDVFDQVKEHFCYENVMRKIAQLNENDRAKFQSFVAWLNEAKECKGARGIDDVSLIIIKLDA